MKFQDYQHAFTAHLRAPREVPRPAGTEAGRMRVYGDLLHHNMDGYLTACFPVSRKVLGQRGWTRLVRAFLRDHVCRTPYFRHIPLEFLDYLGSGWVGGDGCPGFLPELCHYEWIELDLDAAPDAEPPPHDPDGDLLAGRPLANPVSRLLEYRWPVHRLGPRFRPTAPLPRSTHILAYRDAEFAVRFEQLSAATHRLLAMLREDATLTGRAAIGRLAAEIRHPDPEALLGHGATILAGLRRRGALLGIRV